MDRLTFLKQAFGDQATAFEDNLNEVAKINFEACELSSHCTVRSLVGALKRENKPHHALYELLGWQRLWCSCSALKKSIIKLAHPARFFVDEL
jgi:hypothetical protein